MGPTDRPHPAHTNRTDLPRLHNAETGLKTSGKYLARTLSFQDTTFRIEPCAVGEDFSMLYNGVTDLWCVGRPNVCIPFRLPLTPPTPTPNNRNEMLELAEAGRDQLMRGQANYSKPLDAAEMAKHLKTFPSQYWGESTLRFLLHSAAPVSLNRSIPPSPEQPRTSAASAS